MEKLATRTLPIAMKVPSCGAGVNFAAQSTQRQPQGTGWLEA
jgi:hypothetical protein